MAGTGEVVGSEVVGSVAGTGVPAGTGAVIRARTCSGVSAPPSGRDSLRGAHRAHRGQRPSEQKERGSGSYEIRCRVRPAAEWPGLQDAA